MPSARFLEAEPQSPKEEETTSIEARVERYAVNGTVATFVVRASSGPTERTLGVTYEQCRRLHERLRDDGGVCMRRGIGSRSRFRGQRLGLRPTPRQAADQSQQLDAWLQLLTRRTDDLPLACQKAVRSFLELDKRALGRNGVIGRPCNGASSTGIQSRRHRTVACIPWATRSRCPA